ncbi:hypothetical protein LOK49_LG01G00368 [Camellia lanceoleosa]|uniref:Uncharacterized protein n=1 Tax=Camellia lanceoleosa TaxID=1840588 RepID=A0ACC0J3E8_9ERIC|nr:hypothetical protein LOK49_LG01G00368 [Camellia lanceoleosa]
MVLVREYYWIDMSKLTEIYRYKTEEYSYDAVNKINIYPDQISPWLVEWMPYKDGAWPTLLWQLTVECTKMNRSKIAEKAVEVAEKCISRDKWPEYYKAERARFIGKQLRLFQTCSIAGYLVAKQLPVQPRF